MKKVLVVTGSVRLTRATDGIVREVLAELKKQQDIETTLVDIRELKLPMFDAPTPPSNEGFSAEYANVQDWTAQVAQANGVVLLTPEYNAGLSAAQKNAIDWMAKEWKQKPVVAVGYGWHNAESALRHLHDVFERLGAHQAERNAQFTFMKHINLDGSVIDTEYVEQSLNEAIESLIAIM